MYEAPITRVVFEDRIQIRRSFHPAEQANKLCLVIVNHHHGSTNIISSTVYRDHQFLYDDGIVGSRIVTLMKPLQWYKLSSTCFDWYTVFTIPGYSLDDPSTDPKNTLKKWVLLVMFLKEASNFLWAHTDRAVVWSCWTSLYTTFQPNFPLIYIIIHASVFQFCDMNLNA